MRTRELRRLLKKRGIEMQGANTLILNAATIKEAIECWLNGRVFGAGMKTMVVTDFEANGPSLFSITFIPKESSEAPAK